MTALLSIGASALKANYAALQTTGNNIANANTAGYSRQTVQLETSPGQYDPSGFYGKGVNVATVTRAYDQFLTSQANSTSSVSAADAARLTQLNSLEGVFTTGKDGLGYAAGQLLNAFVDVANTPQDSSARQVVLSDAKDLASRFRSAGDQINALQSGVAQDVTSQVAQVNVLAKQAAKLNEQVVAAAAKGQPPNDLLDQRDQAVASIGKLIGVTQIAESNGALSLFVGGGQSLVLGFEATDLKAVPDTYDPAQVQVALADGQGVRRLATNTLGGGSISGLLQFQNEDLVAARNLVGQMATALAGAVNRQQSLGVDQNGATGNAIFSVGAPRALSASNNQGTAAFGIAVSDPSKVQASDYAMRFDGSNYTLVRQSDQQAMPGSPFTPDQLAAGVQVDGMTITLKSGTAASGDTFLLQPVGPAAANMASVLADPRGLAAASPVTATLGSANTGTATVASLSAVDPSLDRTVTAGITFTSASGDYDWQLTDASGSVTASGTGTWQSGSAITLNGFSLQLAGTPKMGDTVNVSPTSNTAANNGNALAFVALRDSGMVAGQTVTDAYASAIASVGVRVQGGKSSASMSSAAASTAETARSNKAGVNLDEEAARLIQFQQSYQAAAKVLQVATAVFDSLLQLGR